MSDLPPVRSAESQGAGGFGFRYISAWSIRNPIPPLVFFLAVTLAGIIAFSRMPVTADPDIDFPMAFVIVAQPGASPVELETQVAQKVEAALRNINGVEEINSNVREGSAQISVQFAIGTPIDRAVNDVRDSVSNIRSDLPDGILEPQVVRVDTADQPIAYISAEAVDMTLEELSWYVDNVVSKRLRSLPGLGGMERGGGVSPRNPRHSRSGRIAGFGISAAQVNAQLAANQRQYAAGGRIEIGGVRTVRPRAGQCAQCASPGRHPDFAGGRAHHQADRHRRSARPVCRTAQRCRLMNGRQVTSFSIQRSKGKSDRPTSLSMTMR
jgi:multidrug efflux pump subunit AcrB